MHVYARALTHRSFCRVVERPEGVEGVRGSVRVGGVGRTDGGVAPEGRRFRTRRRDENTSRRERVAPTLRREDESSPREPERTCGTYRHFDVIEVCDVSRAVTRVRRQLRRRRNDQTSSRRRDNRRQRLRHETRPCPRPRVPRPKPLPAPTPRPAPSPSPRQRNHVTRSLLPASACARDMSRIPDAPAPLSSPSPSPPPRSVSDNSSITAAAAAASTTPSRTTYPRVSSERSVSSSIGAASGG